MSAAGPASPQEQRLLAAVIFTDVVGFSRLSANNESRAYQALQRDFKVMTDLCRNHNGQLLNTMGDGMLMSFNSAVDAMSCAVEIQQTLANQARSLPLSEVLHHRIGVHLGDIIVNGDNVFGDGVNTASRLQTHARPDSIWFSDTVHQVVKNKMKLDCKYVGPRTFKNLGHTVSVWEVAPIAELIAQQQAAASGVSPNLVVEPSAIEGIRGGKAAVMVVGSLLLVGMVIVGIFAMRTSDKPPAEKPRPIATTGEPDDPVTISPMPNPTNSSKPPSNKLTIDQATAQVNALKASYDFTGIVTLLSGNGSDFPNAATLIPTYTSLRDMKAWMTTSLEASSHADPIRLDSISADVFAIGGKLQFEQNGTGFQDFALTQLTSIQFDELAKAIQRKQGPSAPPAASSWIALFAQEYPPS